MTRMLRTADRLLVAAALFAALAACGTRTGSAYLDVDAPPEVAAIRAESLMEADRAFAARARDIGIAEAFVEFMDEDAKLLGAADEPVVGSEAIFAVMATLPDEADFEWSPTEAVVSDSGEMGVTWGVYRLAFPGEAGETIESTGRYLTVWRKDGDGRWRGVLDIGT